jgi:hypothetical protein
MPGYLYSSDGSAPFPGMNGAMSAISDPLGAYKFLFPQPSYSYDPASIALGNISMQQWQEASGMVDPAANKLANMATDPNYITDQTQQAQLDATKQIQNMQSSRSRFFAMQGINPTAMQSKALAKQDALSGAATTAGAMNQAANSARQLQMQTLAGVG